MNAFDAFGNQHARRGRPKRVPRLPETEHEKRQAEYDARAKRYRQLVAQERATVYALPGGAEARELLVWAQRSLTISSGDDLLSRVRRLRPERMPKPVRQRLLADLDDLICRLRKRNGLAEIDDPLPGEPDSVFILLKRMLG